MKVVKMPKGLVLSVSVFALVIPMAALEAMIVSRSHGQWPLHLQTMILQAIPITIASAILIMGILHGSRLSYWATTALIYLWSLASAWIAIRMHDPLLGFFTAFQLLFFIIMQLWLDKEMGRSFFDPHLKWYQGNPKPIAGLHLKCELAWDTKKTQYRISRLDNEGVFIYNNSNTPIPIAETQHLPAQESQESGPKANEQKLILSFLDRKAICDVKSVRLLAGQTGAGFQFCEMPIERKKELLDLIEELRGGGYLE